ncbi:angiopoietin-2-like isoform X1 [Dreissena polymorpha]|uniref:angiopoietin-2-like isoform X1 n=1 Tax=Dreissena polymorpha TaxID=45954 RepID=UPI0022648396|nr:angiopoietin-2-like isoform X1 [Dreissena polymorpha]
MFVVYVLGLGCLLANFGQCEITWENSYNRLSFRLDDNVFDIKSKQNSMMKQFQDLMSMMTATNQKLASFEKRLSELADCSAKPVTFDDKSFHIETYVKEVIEAEVGRLTHLLRRGLEQEKAATMTRFESFRKNQEQSLSRIVDLDTRLNETQVNVSNLEHEVIDTVNYTSILFGSVKMLENTQFAMIGNEDKTRALVSVIEEEVKYAQRGTNTLQSQVQTLVGIQSDLQSKTKAIEEKVDTTRDDISLLQRIVSVDGQWGTWTAWSLCTWSHCTQTRTRACNNPQPLLFGRDCPGLTTQTQECNKSSCGGKDCTELLRRGAPKLSGVYTIITPVTHTKVQVFCDMQTDGGGWTVFQKRFNGSEDFYRNFSDYEAGFGSVYAEYWLGLKYIHEITSRGSYQLRVDIVSSSGSKGYDVYEGFSLQPGTNYTLNLGSGVRSNGLRMIMTLTVRDWPAVQQYIKGAGGIMTAREKSILMDFTYQDKMMTCP